MYLGYSQAVRQRTLTPSSRWFESNYPSQHAGIAQLAERSPCKRDVAGSIPAAGSSHRNGRATASAMRQGRYGNVVRHRGAPVYHGPVVKRSRRHPLKVQSRVRFPSGSPIRRMERKRTCGGRETTTKNPERERGHSRQGHHRDSWRASEHGSSRLFFCYKTHLRMTWGFSSAGRALRWQRRGHGFEPRKLHHETHGAQATWVAMKEACEGSRAQARESP